MNITAKVRARRAQARTRRIEHYLAADRDRRARHESTALSQAQLTRLC
ncbi:MAG: hypothetical protein ACRDRL_04430 [Sciscionella sp.]